MSQLLEKAQEILADYDAGRPLQVNGHGWLVRFAAAIAEPDGPLDCSGVKGTPFTHLFVSHGRKPAYCARCGLMEADYTPPRAALAKSTS